MIQFETQAVARLRERLGAAEEANADLIAFARGHSGAVASIHAAALAAIGARSLEELLDLICNQWPEILGVDLAAVAVAAGPRALRADRDGIERVEPAFVERMVAGSGPVEMRNVHSGHPLFGVPVAADVRAEALIRIEALEPPTSGLIALGQRADVAIDGGPGSQLLHFLGSAVAVTIARCNAG